MGLVDTEGLIIKSYSLAEADKIVVLLTQNEGLVRGVAKGAKRLKSKFGGGLEPFSIVQILYFQKEERELVSIRQIDLLKSYFDNASQPQFLQKFSYLVDLLVEFAPPHDPNERLYRMTKICLETAAENPDNLESIALYFELWILRLGGYLPNWNNCDNCKRELNQNENLDLQINFHLVCANCQKSRNNWVISSEQRQIFITAQKVSPTKFVEFTKNYPKNIKEVSIVLRRIISNILGKETVGEKILTASSKL
ncbi:MAG: DNA repair protein RecO [Acidobacteria bacterium]|jgi:DNA repair protein RecO (recombination protein O)|nr:DNA repair protein RecO [Acidobacteriota bacterium]